MSRILHGKVLFYWIKSFKPLKWFQVSQIIADTLKGVGGKSGLHRAKCQVTPGGREPTESAAEKIPPWIIRVRVKWCGKSAPRYG